MKILQKNIKLEPYKRGFHLITFVIYRDFPEMKTIKQGVAHIFIQHTSASLTINENADFTVRHDFESHFNAMVPENAPYYKHTAEGSDDMPAHIKASILGCSLSIPVTDGKFNLGVWQGIYLCEHRNRASARKLVITVMGA